MAALHLDREGKTFQARGNAQILDLELTALFCSAHCPGDLILKTCDPAQVMRDAGTPVIGGFQTPMNEECLRLLLRGIQPVILCPARSIENMRIPAHWRPALEEERLLALSPFPTHQRRLLRGNEMNWWRHWLRECSPPTPPQAARLRLSRKICSLPASPS